MAEPLPETLLAPLADLGKWLEATNTRAIIVGGVAASFLGRPRFTQDIDALAILAEHPEADLASARRWVREFASATAMSDLINDFERILERRKPGG